MYSIDYYGIGQRIRHIRKAHSFSQEELPSKIGISTTHMSHIETGNTKLSLQVLIDLAKELNVSPDELLFDKNELSDLSLKPQFNELLNHCSKEEIKFLYDILKASKIALT
ncbi:helix-turn-helix domain-containing protein [Agathobacter ruminis]|nr:helix-turn-helix transcriptional regulator [Agathobacter ruminis]